MNNNDFMPMFEIEIEAGVTGLKGDKGDKGDTGEQGIQGPQGEQGIQGIQGTKGETGNDGNGVASVVQTVVSHVSSGVNTWTLTDTNGATYDFNVENGEAGITSIEGTEELPVYLGDLDVGAYLLTGFYKIQLSEDAERAHDSQPIFVVLDSPINYHKYVYFPNGSVIDYTHENSQWRYYSIDYIASKNYVDNADSSIRYDLGSAINGLSADVGDLQSGKEDKSNKVTSISGSSTNAQYPSAKLVYDQLALKENLSNKVTSISGSSTNTQYPSAKLVYDQLALKENASNKVTSISGSSTDTEYPSAKATYDTFVKKTDLATDMKAGIAKIGLNGTAMTLGGALTGYAISYDNYLAKGGGYIIAKDTLENVITGKNLETANNKVTSISGSSTDTQYPSAKLVYDQLATKQATLVSGTNIKTINSASILGSGNLTLFDSSNVKTAYNTTSGNVYDVTYINTLIGDINTALDLINGEVI